MRYTVESFEPVGHAGRGKWKRVPRTDGMTKDAALELARAYADHGDCTTLRVREHGHADGMPRTLFQG